MGDRVICLCLWPYMQGFPNSLTHWCSRKSSKNCVIHSWWSTFHLERNNAFGCEPRKPAFSGASFSVQLWKFNSWGAIWLKNNSGNIIKAKKKIKLVPMHLSPATATNSPSVSWYPPPKCWNDESSKGLAKNTSKIHGWDCLVKRHGRKKVKWYTTP